VHLSVDGYLRFLSIPQHHNMPGMVVITENEDHSNGCHIGTKCPILNAEQDQVYPICAVQEPTLKPIWEMLLRLPSHPAGCEQSLDAGEALLPWWRKTLLHKVSVSSLTAGRGVFTLPAKVQRAIYLSITIPTPT
jgi:hypothetical protein